MTSAVSTNYRQLDPSEVEAVAAECAEAWKHPDIPLRQYELCVKDELERWRRGESIAPFDALIRCWRKIPWAAGYPPTLLDVGASSGYYREVLKIAGIDVYYTGVDFARTFRWSAKQLWPDINFDLGDACQLPYATDSFDVVLSSACIMHIREYEKAIQEAARVSSRYVILNRTPVHKDKPTTFYEKEAYGVPCLEIHFNEDELLDIFARCNLKVLEVDTVFKNISIGHYCYLLRKVEVEPYASNPNV